MGGESFEIEVYDKYYKDKIKLKAITNTSDTGGNIITWNGDNVSGKGLIK